MLYWILGLAEGLWALSSYLFLPFRKNHICNKRNVKNEETGCTGSETHTYALTTEAQCWLRPKGLNPQAKKGGAAHDLGTWRVCVCVCCTDREEGQCKKWVEMRSWGSAEVCVWCRSSEGAQAETHSCNSACLYTRLLFLMNFAPNCDGRTTAVAVRAKDFF